MSQLQELQSLASNFNMIQMESLKQNYMFALENDEWKTAKQILDSMGDD